MTEFNALAEIWTAGPSLYWERRGSAIYTEGRFDGLNEYIEGTAELVIDFNNQIHVDHIDHIINEHNKVLDTLAEDDIALFDDWFGF